MTAKQLRAILTRYGNAGVLFVGSYLLSHHVWSRRRKLLLVSTGLVLALVGGMMLRHSPVRKPTPRPVTRPVVVAPPTVAPLHLSLLDDTAPIPFPAAEGKEPLLAEGSIFFSANFYHWSGKFYTYELSGGKEETLASAEESDHLFRLSAGMTRPQQLTFGSGNDRNPTLSPDGRQLAFFREREERSSLCIVSTAGGRVHTRMRLPQKESSIHLSWSPDGQWLALQLGAYGEKEEILLVSVGSRATILLSDITEADWSPESRLYLRDKDDHARIFQPANRSSVPIRAAVWNAAWLDAHTLLGDSPTPEGNYNGSGCLRIIDDQGRQLRELPLTLIGKENEYTTFSDKHRWYRLPHHPTTMLLETWRWMSDCEHFGCFRVDITTGQARLVADGTLIGIAPDGDSVAVAENAWVGPYKRGGERVGPLKIVSLATGRADSVTDPLSCLNEGVWQSVAAHASYSHIAPQLEDALKGVPTESADPILVKQSGTTALMIAAADGRVEMVHRLLDRGAYVDQTDRNGNTALLYAVGAEKMSNEVPTSAQIAIAEMLLQGGAQINASNHEGYTALMLAANEGRAVVTDWLLRHGATPNACLKWGRTALMLAASRDYSHTVQTLLDAHAALNVKDQEGGTALEIAQLASHGDDPQTETITLLKQAGAIAQP